MRNTIYPVLLLLLVACQNSSTEKQAVQDSTSSGEIIFNELDTLKTISRGFVTIDSTFDIGSFEQTGSSPVQEFEATPIVQEQLQPFLPYLIYSADSTQAIDPYSYNYVIRERNGKKQVADAGPDSEIALVDWKSKTRRRLWFSGPSARIVDVQWKNGNVLLIAGVEEISAEAYIPFIQEINTRTNTVVSYQAGDTLHSGQHNLLKEGLEEKIRTSRVF